MSFLTRTRHYQITSIQIYVLRAASADGENSKYESSSLFSVTDGCLYASAAVYDNVTIFPHCASNQNNQSGCLRYSSSMANTQRYTVQDVRSLTNPLAFARKCATCCCSSIYCSALYERRFVRYMIRLTNHSVRLSCVYIDYINAGIQYASV